MRTLNVALAVAFVLSAVAENAWGVIQYTVTDLGDLGGGASLAYGINAGGQVVGKSLTAGDSYHAFLYNGGTMTDIGTLGGIGDSVAYGINSAGQIVGQSCTVSGLANNAFFYSAGRMTDLGTLGGGVYNYGSCAYGINNSGRSWAGVVRSPWLKPSSGAPAVACSTFPLGITTSPPQPQPSTHRVRSSATSGVGTGAHT